MATDVNHRVREIRKELGLTQKDLAERLGLTFSALSDIERGKNGLSFDVVKGLIMSVGVNPYYLLNGDLPIFSSPDQASSPDSAPRLVELEQSLRKLEDRLMNAEKYPLEERLALISRRLEDLQSRMDRLSE